MIKYRKLKKEKNKPKYTQKIYRQKFCHELLNRYIKVKVKIAGLQLLINYDIISKQTEKIIKKWKMSKNNKNVVEMTLTKTKKRR